MSRRLALFLLGLLLVSGSAHARPVLELRARPALGGQYQLDRMGDVVPVTVTVANRGDGCRLRIVAQPEAGGDPWAPRDRRGEAEVDLPPGSRKRVDLLVPASYGASNLIVTAWEGGEERTRRTVTLEPKYGQLQMAAVLSPDPGAYAWLASYRWPRGAGINPDEISVQRVPAEDFPRAAAALKGLDLVVLHDLPGLALDPESQEALAGWVRQGGRLLVFASPDPAEFRGSPLESLLPLRPTGTATVEGLPLLTGTPDRARVAKTRGGLPLLLVGSRVAGAVGLVTTPLPTTDLLGSQATGQLLERFAKECRDLQAGFPELGDGTTLLAAPPELKPPDLALVAWFLLGYVVLVGPVNWVLLRRRDRMLRIFLTVPVLAGAFAFMAFTGGWMVRGDETLLLESGLLGLRSGDAGARWQGFSALYSPRPARYALRFPVDAATGEDDPGSTSPDRGYVLALGEHLEFRNVGLGMWSMRRFRFQRPVLLRGPLEVTARKGSVEVANHSELALRDCRVLQAGKMSAAFELAPGARRSVPLQGPLRAEALKAPPDSKDRFGVESGLLVDRAVEAMNQAGGAPVLLGWTDRPLGGMECSVEGARRWDRSLVCVLGEVEP